MSQKLNEPIAIESESPLAYSEKLSNYYSATNLSKRKVLGQYFTQSIIAGFMSKRIEIKKKRIRLLDPGMGTGILAIAASMRLAELGVEAIELVGYEVDSQIISLTKKALEYLASYLKEKNIQFSYEIHNSDFILENSETLNNSFEESLISFSSKKIGFDLIIANPPYFKIPKADNRAKLSESVIHGQPNIYSLFMALSAASLNPNGEMIFIVPRSFTSGFYFRKFRENFLKLVTPTYFHIFDSRKLAFKKEEVLQENIILKAVRKNINEKSLVTISTSNGLDDLEHSIEINSTLSDIIDLSSHHKMIYLPKSKKEKLIMTIVNSWKGSLEKYGMQVSTGPVVPFRATEFIQNNLSHSSVPLLLLNHVRQMEIEWPLNINKGLYIENCQDTKQLLLDNKNYVLLRRFSAKEEDKRLVAAPLQNNQFAYSKIGIENHLNYIYRPKGDLSLEELYGLSYLLNAPLIDSYFRIFSCNTQVSATEIRLLPLPDLDLIKYIGSTIQQRIQAGKPLGDLVIDIDFFEIHKGLKVVNG